MIQTKTSFDTLPFDKSDPNILQLRVSFDKSHLSAHDVDVIRLGSQKLVQPFFEIDTCEALRANISQPAPREFFRMQQIINNLPILLDEETCRTKKVQLSINIFNHMKELVIVTTKELTITIDDKVSENFFEGNHYMICRLREKEGIKVTATLEWGNNASIQPQQQALIFPTWMPFIKEKYTDMIIESRGFYTPQTILIRTLENCITNVKRYNQIIKTNAEDMEKNERLLFFKCLKHVYGEPNIYRYMQIDAKVPNVASEFDLEVKNVFQNICSENTDSMFVFRYFTSEFEIIFKTEKSYHFFNHMVERKIEYWENLIEEIKKL